MLNSINTNRILIPLGGTLYLNYDNIILLLEPKEVEKSKWFSTKKVIKAKEDLPDIKSYIYCKNDFLIATSIDVNSLKDKIEEITSSYYNPTLFQR